MDQLERQIEDSSTRNWTIKATIRGQVMRELGVIYNSNYYAISEHPNFSFSKRIHVSEGKYCNFMKLIHVPISRNFLTNNFIL